jgi:hypothetical protein
MPILAGAQASESPCPVWGSRTQGSGRGSDQRGGADDEGGVLSHSLLIFPRSFGGQCQPYRIFPEPFDVVTERLTALDISSIRRARGRCARPIRFGAHLEEDHLPIGFWTPNRRSVGGKSPHNGLFL